MRMLRGVILLTFFLSSFASVAQENERAQLDSYFEDEERDFIIESQVKKSGDDRSIHISKKEETLLDVATFYFPDRVGLALGLLIEMNPDYRNSKLLKVGDVVSIPSETDLQKATGRTAELKSSFVKKWIREHLFLEAKANAYMFSARSMGADGQVATQYNSKLTHLYEFKVGAKLWKNFHPFLYYNHHFVEVNNGVRNVISNPSVELTGMGIGARYRLSPDKFELDFKLGLKQVLVHQFILVNTLKIEGDEVPHAQVDMIWNVGNGKTFDTDLNFAVFLLGNGSNSTYETAGEMGYRIELESTHQNTGLGFNLFIDYQKYTTKIAEMESLGVGAGLIYQFDF